MVSPAVTVRPYVVRTWYTLSSNSCRQFRAPRKRLFVAPRRYTSLGKDMYAAEVCLVVQERLTNFTHLIVRPELNKQKLTSLVHHKTHACMYTQCYGKRALKYSTVAEGFRLCLFTTDHCAILVPAIQSNGVLWVLQRREYKITAPRRG